jgi:hypothetical protein
MLIITSLLFVTFLSAPTDPGIYKRRRQLGWCGNKTEYKALAGLDDKYCVKRFPSSFNRSFVCHAAPPHQDLTGFQPSGQPTVYPDLKGIVEDSVLVTVILIRRDFKGVPYFRYVSNGMHDVPFQPWSSSKIFAAANAASALRTSCAMGLGCMESASKSQLSDLLTVVTSYDTTIGFTSNSLASYFHDIGGRKAADTLIHTWLNASAANESFGGNYGEKSPKSLSTNFTGGTESGSATECTAPRDTSGVLLNNAMSSFTMAEFLKRLVMHREQPEHRLPHIKYEDVQDLLYGAVNSTAFPGLQWGGMSMNMAVWVQRAMNISLVEKRSKGNWRLHGKLGFGFSDTRQQFEAVLNNYLCVPALGEASAGGSVEAVMSVRVAASTDSDADSSMQRAINAIVHWIQEQ